MKPRITYGRKFSHCKNAFFTVTVHGSLTWTPSYCAHGSSYDLREAIRIAWWRWTLVSKDAGICPGWENAIGENGVKHR